MRRLLALAALSTLPAGAQVTAKVVDPDGTAWVAGTWSATLTPPPASTATVGGVPVTNQYSGVMDATGTLSAPLTPPNLMDKRGATWSLTVCPNASTRGSDGGCSTITPLFFAATADISAQVNAVINPPRFTPGPNTYGYSDLEASQKPYPAGVTYYNVTLQALRQWNGQNWIGGSGANVPPATATALGTVQLATGQTTTTLSRVATTGNYVDLAGVPTIPTNNNQLANGAGYVTAATSPVTSVNGQTGAVTVSGGGGSSSAGPAYTPQLSGGAGNATIADPFAVYTAAGSRDFYAFNGATLTDHAYGATTATTSWGRQVMNSFYGPTWNTGSFTNAAGQPNVFITHATQGLSVITSNHSSGISQGMLLNAQHFQRDGDNAWLYGYNIFMPGTTLGGSDEGHAMLRLFDSPSATATGILTSDPTNATGSQTLRVGTIGCGGGVGSSYGSGSCLGAGGWVINKALAMFGNGLHMTSFALVNGTQGGGTSGGPLVAVTVSETLTPDVFVSSTMQIDPPGGAAITIPFTGATGTVPASGLGCLSSSVENTAESFSYTTSGSNLTATGIMNQHESGNLTINLSSPCRAATWIQDETDNNGKGKTAYAVVGYRDAHTVLMATTDSAVRYAGTITTGGSIKPDGGTYGQFQVYPAALVLNVNDPAFNPAGRTFLYTPTILNLGVNNVAWASGQGIELPYNPADTYRTIWTNCADPLFDPTGVRQACEETDIANSIGTIKDFVFGNNIATTARRGLSNVFRARVATTGVGKFGNWFVGMAPTNGYFNNTTSCNNDTNWLACPDAPFLAEGPINITLNRAARGITFNAPGGYLFNGNGVTTTSMVLTGPLTGTTGTFSGALNAPYYYTTQTLSSSVTNASVITQTLPLNLTSNAGLAHPQQLVEGPSDINGNTVIEQVNPGDMTIMLGTAAGYRLRVCVTNCIVNSGYAGAASGGETMLMDGTNVAFQSGKFVMAPNGNLTVSGTITSSAGTTAVGTGGVSSVNFTGADLCARITAAMNSLPNGGTVTTTGEPVGQSCSAANVRAMFPGSFTTSSGLGSSATVTVANKFYRLILDGTTLQSPVQVIIPHGSSIVGNRPGYAYTSGATLQAGSSFVPSATYSGATVSTSAHTVTLTVPSTSALVNGSQAKVIDTNGSAFAQILTVVDATHVSFSTYVNCTAGLDFASCAGGSNYPESGTYAGLTSGTIIYPFVAIGEAQFSERTMLENLTVDTQSVTSGSVLNVFSQTANENAGVSNLLITGSRYAAVDFETGNNSATLGARNFTMEKLEIGPSAGPYGVIDVNAAVEDVRGGSDITVNGSGSASPLAAGILLDGPVGTWTKMHIENATDGVRLVQSFAAPTSGAGQGLGKYFTLSEVTGFTNVTNTVHVPTGGNIPATFLLQGIHKNGGTNVYLNDATSVTNTSNGISLYQAP